MTQTHTPGPWRAEPATTRAGRDILCIGSSKRRLFDMRCYDDEDRANARLIAAAPDMLAALESLADAYANAILYVPQYFREKWRLDDELAKARAAIAKATS